MVAFENYPLDKELENGGMEERLGFSIKVEHAFEQTSFDFNLIVYPGKRGLSKSNTMERLSLMMPSNERRTI
ncbi:hypothetical protein QNN00_01615 [Bacillus velezensis]|nr:hypothetical protein [Bacillus velezensis]